MEDRGRTASKSDSSSVCQDSALFQMKFPTAGTLTTIHTHTYTPTRTNTGGGQQQLGMDSPTQPRRHPPTATNSLEGRPSGGKRLELVTGRLPRQSPSSCRPERAAVPETLAWKDSIQSDPHRVLAEQRAAESVSAMTTAQEAKSVGQHHPLREWVGP